MTRFARSRGSKSSNERTPEEATPWNQMKQELEEKHKVHKKTQNETKEIKKHKKFDFNDIQNSDWAVFEEPRRRFENDNSNVTKKKHKKCVSVMSGKDISEPEKQNFRKTNNLHTVANKDARVQKKDSVKTCSKKIKKIFDGVHTFDNENMIEESESHIQTRKRKMRGKKKRQASIMTLASETNIKDKQSEDLENKHEIMDSMKLVSQKIKYKKRREKKQKIKQPGAESPLHGTERRANRIDMFQQNQNENYNMKCDSGEAGDKAKKPRKSKIPVVQMFINGKEIKVMKFDGFPVKKEDAEHLEELHQRLLKEGIPKTEIVAIMKRERRKAEKALARERKKVCFHCRNSGHVLSQCPELGRSSESGTGICFKCGSTEHTHFQCRVIRSQDFRFAECFVCKEQGHIARQCPDNPRGLYPKGGACRVCGDVTHLKKDCPDLIKEKEQQTVTLGRLDNNSLDILEEEMKEASHLPEEDFMKHKTVVKF
jgi:zinc finger CCHC domain-containing protein 9